MAELRFFHGPMDCGKSTLALQTHHNLARAGLIGALFTRNDRQGAIISSRIGLSAPATAIDDTFRFDATTLRGNVPDLTYIVCDEAQFLTEVHVDELAMLVDDAGIDVYAFGITTDFRSRFFPGSRRLMELADARVELQVGAWCWCGRPGRLNARVEGGHVVYEGDQVVVGDTHTPTEATPVSYVVLCRAHWRDGTSAAPS